MLYFESDYMEGAHEAILQKLAETNRQPMSGYGDDPYSASAAEKIRLASGCPDADVFFLVGGTQTNRVVVDSLLAPYEGVIAAATGHISTHEAGAVEAGGHKVLTLPQHLGKLCAWDIRHCLETFSADKNHEHMVFPGMVYVSWPTEYGTLYTKQELEDIAQVCREQRIPLYLDGARLGYGLASDAADMTLQDIAAMCDAFYIGGTKVGALCGEAVIFPHGNTPPHFKTQAKQHGALLAKGRLLGIQFDTLFTDDLYLQISRHAIEMAQILKDIFQQKGYELYIDSPTNQQFVILENKSYVQLRQHASMGFWEASDKNHTVVRLATSWATPLADIQHLAEYL